MKKNVVKVGEEGGTIPPTPFPHHHPIWPDRFNTSFFYIPPPPSSFMNWSIEYFSCLNEIFYNK